MRSVVVIWFLLVLVSGAQGAAPPGPGGTAPVTVTAVGTPLGEVLLDVSAAARTDLTAEPALSELPLTCYVRNLPAQQLTSAVRELLSPTEQAHVSWARSTDNWELRQSQERRRLVAALRDADLTQFRAHIDGELRWLEERAAHDLRAARIPTADGRLPGGIGSERFVQDRLYFARRYKALSPTEMAALFAGRPLVWRLGDLLSDRDQDVRDRVFSAVPSFRDYPKEKLHSARLSWILCRTAGDPHGAYIWETIRLPTGTGSSSTEQLLPGRKLWTFNRRTFRLAPARSGEPSRRVSLDWRPGHRPDSVPRVTLAQVLGGIAAPCGLQVIADGYRRAPVPFPARLQVENYPIRQLLESMAHVWGFDFRFLDTDERVLLIRDRGWWMEDEAHVPVAEFARLAAQFGGPRPATLPGLLMLPDLTPAQARRLVESEALPRLNGIMTPPYATEGALSVLRLLRDLPEAQRATTTTETGLPLSAVPARLVERHLAALLSTRLGAYTPQEWADWSIRLQRQGGEGWRVRLSTPAGREAHWDFGTVAAGQPRS
jgi:hypothetical protein